MPTDFEIDTNDILGFNFESYCCLMRGCSISHPEKYQKIRKAVMETVRRDAVKNIYKTFFNVLTKGQDINGGIIVGFNIDGTPCKPGYPSNKVSDFAQGAAEAMTRYCNDCVDIILPQSYDRLAEAKLTIKGQASAIN